jgi:O-antigen ligase
VLRLRLWQSALEMVRDHPLWGIGLDQFLYLYPTYMHPDAWREPNLSHPHNLLLDFWLRLGLLGLVALAWAGWKALRRVQKGGAPVPAATARDARASALAWGAAGALVAVVLHGALDNSYFVIDLAYGCWVLLLILELATEPAAPTAPAAPAGGAW